MSTIVLICSSVVSDVNKNAIFDLKTPCQPTLAVLLAGRFWNKKEKKKSFFLQALVVFNDCA